MTETGLKRGIGRTTLLVSALAGQHELFEADWQAVGEWMIDVADDQSPRPRDQDCKDSDCRPIGVPSGRGGSDPGLDSIREGSPLPTVRHVPVRGFDRRHRWGVWAYGGAASQETGQGSLASRVIMGTRGLKRPDLREGTINGDVKGAD